MAEPIKNLIVDGVEHPIEKFSEKVKQIVNIRQAWSDDLAKERLNIVKTEAALRQLDAELSQLVAAELKQTEPAPPEEANS